MSEQMTPQTPQTQTAPVEGAKQTGSDIQYVEPKTPSRYEALEEAIRNLPDTVHYTPDSANIDPQGAGEADLSAPQDGKPDIKAGEKPEYIPDKFWTGDEFESLKKMAKDGYTPLSSEFGRQANELGELRKEVETYRQRMGAQDYFQAQAMVVDSDLKAEYEKNMDDLYDYYNREVRKGNITADYANRMLGQDEEKLKSYLKTKRETQREKINYEVLSKVKQEHGELIKASPALKEAAGYFISRVFENGEYLVPEATSQMFKMGEAIRSEGYKAGYEAAKAELSKQGNIDVAKLRASSTIAMKAPNTSTPMQHYNLDMSQTAYNQLSKDPAKRMELILQAALGRS